MGAALIELETEEFAAAARQLIYSAVDPVGISSRRLWSQLAGCGGMAGSDAGGAAWAAEYDRAAGAALNAAVDAGTAAGQLARMFAQTARNYELADAHSALVLRDRLAAAVSAVPVVPTLSLPGCAPASASGGAPGGPPGWDLIANAVGYLWPNGRQDRLRHAAEAWRASASSLRAAADAVLAAPDRARRHWLPEAQDMLSVCAEVSDRLREIADVHDQLADACLLLAERIDHVHAEVVGELRSLLEWSAGIQAAGAVLSLFSFGAAEAPTQVTEAARIARTAELVAACIQRFTQAAQALATGVGAITERAGLAGARLRRLLDIPLLEPALAGVGPLRVLHEGREIGAVVRLERSAQAPTLAASELAGGHAITRHVGLTDAELIARNLPHASTFPDLATAEAVTARNIAKNEAAIKAWLKGSNMRLEITVDVDASVGRVYAAAARRFIPPREALTVLKKTGKGYYVWTSYLLP